jgi:hypothetical protein
MVCLRLLQKKSKEMRDQPIPPYRTNQQPTRRSCSQSESWKRSQQQQQQQQTSLAHLLEQQSSRLFPAAKKNRFCTECMLSIERKTKTSFSIRLVVKQLPRTERTTYIHRVFILSLRCRVPIAPYTLQELLSPRTAHDCFSFVFTLLLLFLLLVVGEFCCSLQGCWWKHD